MLTEIPGTRTVLCFLTILAIHQARASNLSLPREHESRSRPCSTFEVTCLDDLTHRQVERSEIEAAMGKGKAIASGIECAASFTFRTGGNVLD